ncbi:MAG TPA: hypothetical protein VNP20_10560 [Nocardioidaceae bacterium]|nr:hypothetical protein [Nocardioidaceae bacterium]
MDLDSVAEELYGLPQGDFTSTRNERVKQAKADGDRELAGEIQQLAKPTTAAWLVNQLARERGDELEQLIELGRDLRDATSNVSGDELRELTRQRYQVVHALVQQVRRLGATHGTKVSDAVAAEVQQTLDASLAHSGVAEAVLAGRLTQSVEYAGFGEPAGVTWAGTPKRPAPRSAGSQGSGSEDSGSDTKVADLDARRREAAERAVSDAQTHLETAEVDHERAVEEHDRAADGQRAADEEVERLRTDLAEAEQEARAAARSERTTRDRVKRAEKSLRDAERARQEAEDRLRTCW